MIFTRYQKFVVGVLAFLQFTIVLDFMVISPLGAILMPALNITPKQFGIAVSAYAFSAGIAGLFAAGFADNFDRKRLLLFFYAGFVLGTLLCGLAPTYEFLLFARIITGLFGGVIGSISFAIVTDLFPYEKRGRVMGFVQTSFAASQVLGIPLSLYLSNLWGWHAPFMLIVGVSLVAGVLILIKLNPIREHLNLKRTTSPFAHLAETVTNGRYLHAFATTALLATGGFMMMPFGSDFSVNNLGIPFATLPMVYMITGVISFLSGPLAGVAADRIGKFKIFALGSLLTICMVLIYTRLEVTPIAVVILISSLMFVGITSRIVSSSALISAVPAPASRGSFMAVSSSIQQMAGGVASLLAGHIVEKGEGGRLLHFDTLGHVVVGSTLFTIVMMYSITRRLSVPDGAKAVP